MESTDGVMMIKKVPNILLRFNSMSIDSAFWIMKMIFHILPQLRSNYLCQLCLTLIMLR